MPGDDLALVAFGELASSDLVVDAVYAGGLAGNRSDDPLHPLLGVGNAGGFRIKGSVVRRNVRYGALYTSGSDPDWPDVLDVSTGLFTYHGDQKTPGKDLHDTPRKGNLLLRDIFAAASVGPEARSAVPPLFLFEKAGQGADAIFRGLIVPGGSGVRQDEQLVAVWRSRSGRRYQNYRAIFTVLDVARVSRRWIQDIQSAEPLTENAPRAWRRWVETGAPRPLRADRPLQWRTREEQLPSPGEGTKILAAITQHFAANPTGFEPCAALLWQMMAPAAETQEITRAVVDHGRDAIGTYSLGPASDPIKVSFSLEAKCYAPTTPVTTRHIARLISRIRHREFGVMVTTSYVHKQAYEELREDAHPVVVICGRDIVDLLQARGFESAEAVKTWLQAEFPHNV